MATLTTLILFDGLRTFDNGLDAMEPRRPERRIRADDTAGGTTSGDFMVIGEPTLFVWLISIGIPKNFAAFKNWIFSASSTVTAPV